MGADTTTTIGPIIITGPTIIATGGTEEVAIIRTDLERGLNAGGCKEGEIIAALRPAEQQYT
jgi:hypothetical protein